MKKEDENLKEILSFRIGRKKVKLGFNMKVSAFEIQYDKRIMFVNPERFNEAVSDGNDLKTEEERIIFLKSIVISYVNTNNVVEL